MKMKLGVIIGRFQVDELTPGHQALIATVLDKCHHILFMLGVPPVPGTKRNPLSYDQRAVMISQACANVRHTIVPIPDQPENEKWVQHVDTLIRGLFPGAEVTIYGGRDSCLDIYLNSGGKFQTEGLPTALGPTGTERRAGVMTTHSAEFRAGAIWHSEQSFDGVYPCVDMVIFKGDLVLLARKHNDPKDTWRLVGGFVDRTDRSYEDAAQREILEETGLGVARPKYVGSVTINDWRFRGGKESIKSAVFAVDYIFGNPVARDDISELAWFDFVKAEHVIHPIHELALGLALVDRGFRKLAICLKTNESSELKETA